MTPPARRIWRAPLAVLLAWLLAIAAAGMLIARLPFSADLSAFLPKSPNPRQQILIEQLESGVASRSLLIAIDGGDAATRAAASRALAAALRASGHFEQVQNGDRSDAGWEQSGRWLFEHRYLLSPAVEEQRFSVDGLREAIDETLSLLGTPAGNALKPLLDRDPTGETQRIAENLLPAQAPRSEEGVWVAREAPRALLLASLHAEGADLDRIERSLAAVHQAFAPLAAQGLQLRMSGTPVFAVDSRAQIQHEVKMLAIAGAIVVGGLLLLAFGSAAALGVALLPVVSGIVCGVLAVGLVFGNVHGLTLAFGSTLIGESVDYAIYYLIQARSPARDGLGWQRWRQLNWPTVRLGLLTSVCGFGALLFSGFPGLAQLGLFSIAGLSAAALTTRFVLPRLVPDGAAGQGLRRHLAAVARAAVGWLPTLRWPALLLGVAAVLLLAGQWGQLWRGSLGSLSPISPAAQALDASLRADLGASDARTMVVASGSDVEAALRAAEAAVPRLESLVASGLLAGFETPTRLLPSQATQQQRLASLPPAQRLRQNLAEATSDGPLPAGRLAPFVDEVEQARQRGLITRVSLDGTAFAPAVDALLFERDGGGWSALLPLHPAGEQVLAEPVRAALQGIERGHDVQVVDIKHELDSLYAHYLEQALLQAGLGACGVVVLLALQLRSARRLGRVCGPLALAVLLTLGGLALLDVELGVLHLVGLLLVIAVGSNYGLFFDQLRSEGRADADTLASLLLANLTTVLSFGLIALSEIPALSAIGRVVAPGALLALLLAAVMSRPGRIAAAD
ncbi:MMPL family transporter [Piscinibacter sakaiensis]|uniref:MMPL family transporter n=1 Tax=Piscinibacter sakaiensis TaxID=1547922 RepID=UPI003AAA8AC5